MTPTPRHTDVAVTVIISAPRPRLPGKVRPISRLAALRWILLAAGLALPPAAARAADDLATAHAMITKGDLHGAQVVLRKLLSQDPQNAEAHYWLGRVSFDLGDPVAGETQATAAQARGYDSLPTLRLLGQALLAQAKFDTVLATMRPDGKDTQRDAIIQVLRGYALLGQQKPDAAEAAFADAARLAPNAIEPLLAQSRLALLRNDLATAQTQLDRALTLQPNAPEALLAKAQLLRMRGHPDEAITVLNLLLASHPALPDAVQARLDRANLEITQNILGSAKSDIDTVLSVTPGNVPALYLRAAMAAQAKDYAQADAQLARIDLYLDRVPRAWLLTAMVKEQLGQLEQAETAAQRYLAQAPNDIAAHDIAARIQFDKHRPDLVIKTLQPLAASGKADKGTWELLGGAYATTGQAQLALEAYQNALILAPTDVDVQTRLASLRVGIGQPNIAVTDLEHTLASAPTNPGVSEALFFAALATGDLNATAAALDKIRAVQGDTAVVGHLQGLLKQAQLDITGAQRSFTEVVRKYPEFAPAKISLAHLLAVEGHTEQADKLLGDILARHPASEPALTLLAGDDLQAKRPSDAIALMERARAAEPDNMDLVVRLGDILIRTGGAQKALDLIGKLSGAQRSRPEIISLRANAEVAIGNKDAARATLVTLLAQTPTDLAARELLIGLLLEAGDSEGARNVVKDGIAAMPRTYPLLRAYVMIELKTKGLDAALAMADQLAAQDRGYVTARALRGDVYLAANRTDDAIAAFTAALAVAPAEPLLTRLIGAQLRLGRFDDMRTTMQHWLDTHPTDLRVRAELAQVDIATKRLDEAAENLRMVLDERPHDPVALNNLAWIYQQQNDPRALELARQAYVLAPNAQNTDTLGWILTNAGHADLGALLLHQADVESQGAPSTRFHLAVALKNLGQRDEAIRLLTPLAADKRAFPEKADARQLLETLRKGT